MIISSIARRLRLINWLRRVFHNPSTAFPQAEVLSKLDAQALRLGDINHEFVLLRRDVVDFEERTARKLDRYRKWASERKGGKFGNQGLEDAAQSTNDNALVPEDTHKAIAARAREKGLIS